MITLSLNGLDATSVRLFQPWTGAWTAEVDFDLDVVPVVPTGPAQLVIGTTTLIGTIDSSASGKFGVKGRARIVGGGGGWAKTVASRQFHNDAGVLSSIVVAATAAEVGESAVVVAPSRLGVDFERTAGPASRVLAGLDWYVNLAGVTTVGPRVQVPADPLEVNVLTYDPFERRAEIGLESAILMPGTLLVDPRFGTAIVRDVEQTFTASGGARAQAWCGGDASPRLATLLTSFVNERARTQNLRTYHYRVVSQNPADGRLTLQAVTKAAGAPDSIAISPWYGVPGLKSLVTPGSECAVVFLDGDPGKPAVIGFKGGDQLSTGVATQESQAAFVAALAAFVTAAEAFFNFPGVATISGGTAQPAAAAAAALVTTAALPTNYSLKTQAP